MSTEKLANSVLNKIKQTNLKPRPKWYFILKNSLFWTVFVLCALVGARATGVTIFALTEAEFGLIGRAPGHPLVPWLQVFPFFWIIFFLLFLLLATYGLHETKKGYKLSLSKLIGLNLTLSLVIGLVSFGLGDAERFEAGFRAHAPFYHSIGERKEMVWSNPEAGRLAGTIIEIQENQIMLLDDFQQKRWTVDYLEAENWGPIQLEPDKKIKMAGEVTSKNTFKAKFISPWGKPENGHPEKMPPPPYQ